MNKISVLDVPMHAISMHETLNYIEHRIESKIFTQHVVVNVAKIINARKDQQLFESIVSSDLINIDGMGVVWGARFLGHKIPERVTGIDLFNQLVERSSAKKHPIFLLGAKQVVVEKVHKILKEKHPELIIAGYNDGYFEGKEEEIVNKIRGSGARLLFVAMSSPKKEKFINKWQSQLSVDFVMGVGGTFDVISGYVSRAPLWMQNSGLEWLYRVIQEPRRMWKRYLITNSYFLLLVLKSKFLFGSK